MKACVLPGYHCDVPPLGMQVSIASEIGWHVTQEWYYQDNFYILNAGEQG